MTWKITITRGDKKRVVWSSLHTREEVEALCCVIDSIDARIAYACAKTEFERREFPYTEDWEHALSLEEVIVQMSSW
jgi:hypothetical protein